MFVNVTKYFGVILVNLLLMIGCATTPERGRSTESLYDGKAKTLYDAKQKVTTSEEAIELGNRALQVGDIDRALYRFVVAYELDPSEYDALHKVGVIHAQRGSLDRAALAFNMVLKENPDHDATLLELGLIEIRKRHYPLARKHLEKAIERNPQLWRVHNGLGVLADLSKDFDTARQHYDNALTLNPGSPPLLNNLGYSRYLAGDWRGARDSIEAALDVNPSYRRALLNLGLIHVREGWYDEAVATFEKVMEKPAAYERIGTLCLVEGNYDGADRFLNLAIASSSTYYKEAYDKLERLRTLRDAPNRPEVEAPERIKTSLTVHEISFADSRNKAKGKNILYPPDLSIGVTRRPSRFTLDQTVW